MRGTGHFRTLFIVLHQLRATIVLYGQGSRLTQGGVFAGPVAGGQGPGARDRIHTVFRRAWLTVGVQGRAAVWTKSWTKADAVRPAVQPGPLSEQRVPPGCGLPPSLWLVNRDLL